MNKQKRLSPIVIIVMIAILFGGYLIYQNQFKSVTPSSPQTTQPGSDEAANWKTYTNTKYGYSIKYPTDWIVNDPCIADKQFLDCSAPEVSIKSLEKFTLNEQDINYSIRISKLDKDPRDTTGLIAFYVPPGGYKEEKINSIDVLKGLGMNNTLEFYFKKRENNYIWITFGPYSEKAPFPKQGSFYKTFNKILSTFKFTDQNQADTFNWKTYTNTKWSFSFKYPSQFTLKEDKSESIQYPSGTRYSLWFYITEDGKERFSGYSVTIHSAPGKTLLQAYPQEARQQAQSVPIKLIANKYGAGEAASATDNQYGTLYFRVKDNFFEINPIYQDSTANDKIWNYPVLDTLKFAQ